MNKYIKKGDLIILGCIFIVCMLLMFVWVKFSGPGAYVIIKSDNKVVGKYDLHKDGLYRIESDNGYNIVAIKEGEVFVVESDCHNQICVNTHSISSSGQSIMCLPHKMLVTITGRSGDVDVYTK